jgi:hypothetical protein
MINDLDTIKNHIDECIVFWRKKRDEEKVKYAYYYIDAYQSIRASIFGEMLGTNKNDRN